MARKLTTDEIAQYADHGYLHAPGVVDRATIDLGRRVMARWVDEQIADWLAQGRIDHAFDDLDLDRRLLVAWNAADKPGYVRSPRRDLLGPDIFDFLRTPALLDAAASLLGTDEILVHGVFNARPKLPDQLWTDTPWHQDAQYYEDAKDGHVVSIWIPLVRVTEANSCLQVAPDMHRGPLYEAVQDKTGFIGLSPAERAKINGVSVEMDPGDILCFPQLTPHRAMPNRTDTVRWSLDVRYEDATDPTPSGLNQGFVARSRENPDQVSTYDAWLTKWEDIPRGAY